MSDENENVFRDISLYVMTTNGPIRITGDQTLRPGELRLERPYRVSTTCARCSATIDPAAVEQHHEKCFVVGDWVRWQVGERWHEGQITALCIDRPATAQLRLVRGYTNTGYPFETSFTQKNLRHIQRPGQAVAEVREQERHRFIRGAASGPERLGPPDETCATCQCDPRNTVHHADNCKRPHRGAGCGCAMNDEDHELRDTLERIEPIAPTLYDGLTAEECWHKWSDNAYWTERPGPQALHAMTPSQIAAAKVHNFEATKDWPRRLRARISAAKERERLTVRVDDQSEP